MRALRQFKNAVALLTALADLAGIWPVMTVTRRLSEAADAAVGAAVRFLFRQAAARGEWQSDTARRLYRARHGQVRSLRAQLLVRHRPHRLLRSRPHPAAAGRRDPAFLRAPDARSRAPAARAHRRRLRVPHRSAAAARPRRHADGAVDGGGAQLLRELRAELGARRPHQGAAGGRRPGGRAGRAGRPRPLHLAQVSRLRGHRRHSRHEAADPRLPRLRRDRRGRPQHQGRARRHPRGGVLRADPAADRRRAPARAARQRDAGGAGASGGTRLDRRRGGARAGGVLSLPAHGRASPADDCRRADADAADGYRQARRYRPLLRLCRFRLRSRRN